MRKDNPPIENPILNLMDKRKKKLHFRYTNTDFINYDSFFKNIPSEPNWIIENFSWKKWEVGKFCVGKASWNLENSYWNEIFSLKVSVEFSNCLHYFLNIKFSIFPINVSQTLPSQPFWKFPTRPCPKPKNIRPCHKTRPMLKLEIRQENQTQSVTDLNDEEKLALFRVGRRRRPTQFQIFTGPGRDKSDHLFKQPIR